MDFPLCSVCGLERASATKAREFICLYCKPGRAPGIIGLDHPNEVNPDVYDPVKERTLALKYMNNTDGVNKLTNDQAAFIHRNMVVPERNNAQQYAATPKATRDMQTGVAKAEVQESQRRFDHTATVLKKRLEITAAPAFHRIKKAAGND